MSDANQNIGLGAERIDAGLGDAVENLLWKPQNIQVLKNSFPLKLMFDVLESQDHSVTEYYQ